MFRDPGFGLRVPGFGFQISRSVIRILGTRIRDLGPCSGFRVPFFWFNDSGSGFRTCAEHNHVDGLDDPSGLERHVFGTLIWGSGFREAGSRIRDPGSGVRFPGSRLLRS